MKEKKDQSMQVALVAFGISFLNMNLTCCMCGHMGWISLPGNVVGIGAVWYAFLAGKDKRLLARVIVCLTVLATNLIFLKNIGDILWWGHEAIFG